MAHTIKLARSFRLMDEDISELQNEADMKNMSLNNFVNRVIKDYLTVHRWAEKGNCITIDPEILKDLLEKIDEKEINDIGKNVARRHIPPIQHLMGISSNSSGFLNILGIHGGCAGWFVYSNILNSGNITSVYLKHYFGLKWSIFLEGYLTTVAKEMCGVQISCERQPDFLIIKFLKH